jgi:hypothetical protein
MAQKGNRGTRTRRRREDPRKTRAKTPVRPVASARPARPERKKINHRKELKASKPTPLEYCQEPDCETPATARGYCRLHYIKNWKILQNGRRGDGSQLPELVDELVRARADYDDRMESVRAPRSLDLEFAEAREDVEEMFREMGFEEDV